MSKCFVFVLWLFCGCFGRTFFVLELAARFFDPLPRPPPRLPRPRPLPRTRSRPRPRPEVGAVSRYVGWSSVPSSANPSGPRPGNAEPVVAMSGVPGVGLVSR